MSSSKILQDQIAYYRARAGEYDEWFYRVGRYDHGEATNRLWFADVQSLVERVHQLGPVDSTLELAAGTGNWTKELAQISATVVALDAAPEVIAINRDKVKSDCVDYRQADLFQWQPDREYDLVFMAFWMSHVPPETLDSFLDTVRRATRIGGRVFMIDSLPDAGASASNHEAFHKDMLYDNRKLNDGREFKIYKRFYDLDQLRATLERHGFSAETGTTDRFFWWANGQRAR